MRRTTLWAAAAVVSGTAVSPVHAQEQAVYRVQVSGTIELGLAPYIARSLREAEAEQAPFVVLEIETPGGRVDAAQQIVRSITESGVPVYAYVNTHAWSAGAMIALAADSIFMAPGSSIGAATPVGGDGQKAPEKIVSALRGEFRALAERRGLDPRIAEAMVDEEIAIDGVVEAGKLLTVTGQEAVTIGLASAEVENLDALLERFGAPQADVTTTSVNWAEQLVRFLSHPVVSPILLSIGVLGIMIEIKTPTFGAAGLVGLTSFAAFFGSHYLVGLAGLEEVLLLLVGVIALLLEVFVVPGFGVAGMIAVFSIGGAVFLSLLGSLPTWGDIARASGIVMVAFIAIAAALYTFLRTLPGEGRMRGVFLRAATDKASGYVSAPDRDDLIGAEGVAETDLHPSGIATIEGERLDVVSEGGFIAQGSRVRVLHSDGYRHVVTRVEEIEPASTA